MTPRHKAVLRIVAAVLISTLACRPVITVGYTEMLIVAVIGLILLGPLLFRLYRLMVRFQSAPPPSKEKASRQSRRSKRHEP